ncbi:MAG TPA: hypothetical protein VLA00_14360 [Xanthobacteraceae bacterium]|nr:hypothetical protein [Xanthobacteraceae bacterium]
MPRRTLIVAGLIAGGLLSPIQVAAQETPVAPLTPATPQVDAAGNRFTVTPVDGGLMRLDTRTGALSFCSARVGTWACELVPEERTAYEAEIARLNDRIATLESGTKAKPAPDEPERQLDRAMDLAEGMFQRFLRMVERFRGEAERL